MNLAASPSTPKERGSARWALVPVVLLASSFFGVGGMAVVAIRDPNFALEPDYYQKALHWDQVQAQAANNQRFGYTFSAPPSIALDGHGHASFEVKIKARNGREVTGARVIAIAFPNAYSEEVSPLQFSERVPGVYTAPVSARHAGLWEFRLSMDSAADHATVILRSDLTPGAA
jgi:FixH